MSLLNSLSTPELHERAVVNRDSELQLVVLHILQCAFVGGRFLPLG